MFQWDEYDGLIVETECTIFGDEVPQPSGKDGTKQMKV